MKKIFPLIALSLFTFCMHAYTPSNYSYYSSNQYNTAADTSAPLQAITFLGGAALTYPVISFMEEYPLTDEWHAFTSGVFGTGLGLAGYAAAKISSNNDTTALPLAVLIGAAASGLYYKFRPGWRLRSALKEHMHLQKNELNDVIVNTIEKMNANDVQGSEFQLASAAKIGSYYPLADAVDELTAHHHNLKKHYENLARLEPYSVFQESKALETPDFFTKDRIDKAAHILKIMPLYNQNCKEQIAARAVVRQAAESISQEKIRLEIDTQNAHTDRIHAHASQQHAQAYSEIARAERSRTRLAWFQWFFGR